LINIGSSGPPDIESKYNHPVISDPKSIIEKYLVNDYNSARQDYVKMVGSIKNIHKVISVKIIKIRSIQRKLKVQ
jgi:hypothetical protein